MNLFLHALLNRLIIDAYNVYYLLHKHVGIIIKTIYIAIFKNRKIEIVLFLYLFQYYSTILIPYCTIYTYILLYITPLYTVYYSVAYNVSKMYSDRRTVYNIHCKMYIIHCTLTLA